MQKQSRQIVIKLVFAGKHGVGKTSLLRRQSLDQFTNDYIATIGVDFKIKHYQVKNIKAKVQLWDSAGQERFRSIQAPYFRGAQAVLLCFDLSDKNSFETLQKEIAEIKALNLKNFKIYLIGCKSDLQPQVFTDEILVFSEKHDCQYFQTSSKQNEGVHDCFQAIVSESTQLKVEQMAFTKTESKLEIRESEPVKKKVCC